MLSCLRFKLLLGAAVLIPSAAVAQSAPASPDVAADPTVAQTPAAAPDTTDSGTRLEEIVVTAQRREERLMDVPVSVTAFTAKELQARQIVDVRSLAANTPSLTFTQTPYGTNDLLLSIRGVAPGGVLPNVDQAVGTYVDGIYYARPQGSNFALVDMSSAEVLRGPQGTLFGRNTIAGALNITTNRPSYQLGGSATLSAGNYDAFGGTGVVNLPLIADHLATRLVYSHAQHRGFGRNLLLNSDVADQNDDFVRVGVRADPTSQIRVDLSGDFYKGRNHQPLWVLPYYQAGLSPANLAPFVAAPGSRISQAGYNPINNTRVYGGSANVSWNLGGATLKSITGYRRTDFEGASDQDATPLPIADVRQFALRGSQFSQEVQLFGGKPNDRFTWVVGGYYFHEKFVNTNISRTPAVLADNTIRPENSSASGFAQATFEIIPHVRLTGGVRYVHDDRRMTYTPARFAVAASQVNNAETAPGTVTPAVCPYTAIGLNQDPNGCFYRPDKITFHYVPFTLGVDYHIPHDMLVYARYSKGYRSGGFQQASGTTRAFFTPFGAENVSSYEVGGKFSLLHDHLRLSAAAYHSTYNDIQQTAVLSSSPIVINVLNAGRAKIYGGEVEATALLGKLRLGAGLGLIHPTFTSGPYTGSKVPTVAKTTYSVSADYPLQLASVGTLNLHVDYNHRSKVYFLNTVRIVGTTPVPYSPFQIASVTQAGYGLLNARVGLDLKSLPLTLSVYGRNLTNEYYAGRSGSFYGANYNSIVVGEPRTYGASATYRF